VRVVRGGPCGEQELGVGGGRPSPVPFGQAAGEEVEGAFVQVDGVVEPSGAADSEAAPAAVHIVEQQPALVVAAQSVNGRQHEAELVACPGKLVEESLRRQAASLPAELAGVFLTGFVGEELPDVLALADVVISRSGAGTLAELTALGKAAGFIPLATSAGVEQLHNAGHLQEAGAAVALLGEVPAQTLAGALEPLLADPSLRAAMPRAGPRARPAGRGREAGGRDPLRRIRLSLAGITGASRCRPR